MKGWYGNSEKHSLASKGVRTKELKSNGMLSYAEWKRKIDELFWEYIGLGMYDMPDYIWRDLYDDELSPEDAFASYIEDNLDEFGDVGWDILRKMNKLGKQEKKIPEMEKYEVGVIDENGKEYYEYFNTKDEAQKRWSEYKRNGNETWISEYDERSDYYETIQTYDPDKEE